VKASPTDQLRLLDVQADDRTLDQLAHRRRTLPEIATLEAIDGRIAKLRDNIVRLETQDGDMQREQRKIEADVDVVRQRVVRDQQRLDSGAGSAKDLEHTQGELVSLARRQSDLEDQVLEVMERREAVQIELDGERVEFDKLSAEKDELTARRDAVFAEIDGDIADVTQHRAAMVATVPAELVTLYEKIRASSGGVGAAKLYRGRCEGCRLELSGTDLSELRAAAPDEVVRCEECRRILVRTDESGL
jgi:predicted  nucleic acid-binding Zn-ribbon protein